MAAPAEAPWPFSKTKMCKFHILGQCVRGTECQFAHSTEELQPLPDLARTKLCKALLATGKCRDPHCTYAHNKEEFRSGLAVDRSKKAARSAVGATKPAAAGGASPGATSTAKQNSAEVPLPTPAIWPEDFASTHFGMPWDFGWQVPLETNMMCMGVGDYGQHTSFVNQWDDVETRSGSHESGALSEEVNQEDGPVYIGVGTPLSSPPTAAPLKLVRSADGELCALGDA